jgi:hypothetical protein
VATDTKPVSSVKAHADDARNYWLDEGRTAGGFIRQIDHSRYAKGTHALFNGIKIVDCDTHFTEPSDLFQRDAAASMKHKLPRVVRVGDADRWFIGDKDFGSIGGNVIRKDRNKLLGKLAFTTYDQIHPGVFRSIHMTAAQMADTQPSIRFEKATVTIGARVHGIASDQQATPQVVQVMREALHEHGVLFFEFGKRVEEDQLKSFSRLFGELEYASSLRARSPPFSAAFTCQQHSSMPYGSSLLAPGTCVPCDPCLDVRCRRPCEEGCTDWRNQWHSPTGTHTWRAPGCVGERKDGENLLANYGSEQPAVPSSRCSSCAPSWARVINGWPRRAAWPSATSALPSV